MIEFFHLVGRYQFLQYALAMAVLAGIACGIVGTYVVTRRISYIAGSIAHCVLGGMGAARYYQVVLGWEWLSPLKGAVFAALAAAIIIGWVSLRAKQREDTVIGAIWAMGMAIGILFIYRTPGYNEELMSYLFGSILLISTGDLRLMVELDVLVIVLCLLFYHQFLAVCFDEEFARLRGLKVEVYYLLLLCLTALTVVVLLKVVGIIMVVALLTLPAAVASYFSRTLAQMMGIAVALCILLTCAGLVSSYGPGLPAGAMTIVFAGLLYILVVAGSGVARRLLRSRRRSGGQRAG
jgi:zinc transport system permease protein